MILLPFKLCYLLLGRSSDILYLISKVFKLIFKLLPWVVRTILLTHCSDSLVDYQCSGLFSNRTMMPSFTEEWIEFTY